jgi:hypothetical protein
VVDLVGMLHEANFLRVTTRARERLADRRQRSSP